MRGRLSVLACGGMLVHYVHICGTDQVKSRYQWRTGLLTGFLNWYFIHGRDIQSCIISVSEITKIIVPSHESEAPG